MGLRQQLSTRLESEAPIGTRDERDVWLSVAHRPILSGAGGLSERRSVGSLIKGLEGWTTVGRWLILPSVEDIVRTWRARWHPIAIRFQMHLASRCSQARGECEQRLRHVLLRF